MIMKVKQQIPSKHNYLKIGQTVFPRFELRVFVKTREARRKALARKTFRTHFVYG